MTGVFPADKRFPASLVTSPIAKKQLKLDHAAVSVWPENSCRRRSTERRPGRR